MNEREMYEQVPQPTMPLPAGANVIGDLGVESGLGQVTITTLDAMLQSGVPVAYLEHRYHLDARNWSLPSRFSQLPRLALYPTNLLFCNIHEMPGLTDEALARLTGRRYTVGVWTWELSQLPSCWIGQPERVDEIWVPSRHVALSMGTDRPVQVVPYAVEVAKAAECDKGQWGIAADRYVFLFTFDALSCDARKHPLGVVRAFARAFGRGAPGGPLLVIKARHLSALPRLRRDLAAAVRQVRGILLADSLSRQGTEDLLAMSDVFVSLHRAEGFGLGMAEAMALGKPVIATGYSGNLDFMTPTNSYLVAHQLRVITRDDHRYRPICATMYEPGLQWAEPDIEQAATYMAHLYEHPDEGRERGQLAARDMRANNSAQAVGRIIAGRLAAIEAQADRRGSQRISAAWPPPAAGADLTSPATRAPVVAAEQLLKAAQDQSQELVARHRALVGEWHRTYDTLNNGLVARFPRPGHALRVVLRLARLGRMQSVQTEIGHLQLEEIEALTTQLRLGLAKIAELEQRVHELEEAVGRPHQPAGEREEEAHARSHLS